MGTLLALASALGYGFVEFVGGMLSRRADSAAVAFVGQVGGLVLLALAVLVAPAATPTTADLLWGGLSGVGTGVAMMFLFRGLVHGAMSVVVPLAAVGGLALPVVVGVVLLGDRPSVLAWFGVVCAVPALWLLCQTRSALPRAPEGTSFALVASVGIAVQYLALSQAEAGSGLWPVLAGRVAAILTIAVLAVPTGHRLRLPARLGALAAANGGLAAVSLTFYMVATRHHLLSIAVVLASLYPAVPVLLGITLLREHLSRYQVAGLVGASAAVVLIALG